MRRDKKNKQKEKNKTIGKVAIALILLIMVALGSYLGYSIQVNGGGLQGLLATVLGQDAEKLENLDIMNVLVLRN